MTRARVPSCRRLLSRFRRDESGTWTMEFVMIFPVFMLLLFAAFESGWMMTRYVLFERSVDLAVRDLRIGTPPPLASGAADTTENRYIAFRKSICDKTDFIENCEDRIRIELQPVSMDTWGPLDPTTECRNIEEPMDPVSSINFVGGGNNELMMVRVCALYRPIFPTTGLAMSLRYNARNDYALVYTTAYVNEPSR